MTEEYFAKICNKIIRPLGNKMVKNLDATFVLCDKQVYLEYQRQKTLFRHLCNKNIYDENEKNLLDRHKVCAALCVALLYSNPIYSEDDTFDDNQINLGKGIKLNEQLAIASSLCLLRSFITFESNDGKKSNNYFNIDNFFEFPSPHQGDEPYVDALVRTVFFARLCGQLNLYLLAHIFFIIEQYHFLSITNQNQNPCDPDKGK